MNSEHPEGESVRAVRVGNVDIEVWEDPRRDILCIKVRRRNEKDDPRYTKKAGIILQVDPQHLPQVPPGREYMVKTTTPIKAFHQALNDMDTAATKAQDALAGLEQVRKEIQDSMKQRPAEE